MQHRRGGVSCCTDGNALYAVGGFANEQFLAVVEVYEPRADRCAVFLSHSSSHSMQPIYQLLVFDPLAGTQHASLDLCVSLQPSWLMPDRCVLLLQTYNR